MEKMASKFITNQDAFVSEMMKNIMPDSAGMSFLVGYFYFSGFEQIYSAMGDRHLRILVGMDVERDIAGRVREFETLSVEGEGRSLESRAATRARFEKSLVDIVNDTDCFDAPEKEKAFAFFLGKIRDGSLEIRKTLEPNHAKLYLFEQSPEHSQGGSYPGTVITGSSNLTWSGLRNRYEVNVVLRDPADYADATRIFEDLWKDSVPIADGSTVDEFFTSVVDRVWLGKLPAPYLVFLRVLDEYFTIRNGEVRFPNEITNEEYFDVRYQTDAIRQGIAMVKKHSGCIVADVVGLGKSVIASAIAYNLKLKTVVVAPPHLVPQWEQYAFEFGLSARVYSCGKLEEALSDNEGGEEKLIIVDEAHRFRNEETLDYGILHRLCQGNKVLLLTATPFNNKPADIFALLKLFQIPSKATIETVSSLGAEIERLTIEYKRLKKEAQGRGRRELEEKRTALVGAMRDLLSPVLIRRSRIDLEKIDVYREDLTAQNITFPKVADPIEVDYDLGELSGLYVETLDRISPEDAAAGFIGARYKPFSYLKSGAAEKYQKLLGQDRNLMEQSQENLAAFMKRLLVRRFESSLFAFKSSLDAMIASSENVLRWYETFGKVPLFKRGKIPDFAALEEDLDDRLTGLLDESLDAILAESLSKDLAKGLVLIDRDDFDPALDFLGAVKADLALLGSIREAWVAVEKDPKLEAFGRLVSEKLASEPERKFVVFSEFADTVDYLARELSPKKMRVFKYTSGEASRLNKDIIRMNFDAGASERKNDYDLLVATDAISEGFSLHRAGAVFNYDIPYNPTRVIQRVGRINRVNRKVFDTLYIYNFFPSVTGESVIHARSISSFKLSLIQAIMGEDTKILADDEELRGYVAEAYRRAAAGADSLSWDVEYLNILNAAAKSEDGALTAARCLPRRTRVGRSLLPVGVGNERRGAVLVFARKGEDYRFTLAPAYSGPALSLTAEEGVGLFRAERGELPRAVSEGFAAHYARAKSGLLSGREAARPPREQSEAADRVQFLLEQAQSGEEKDYLERLLSVIAELGALPAVYLKRIRRTELGSSLEAVRELRKDIPDAYLDAMLEKARLVGAGPEEIILAEELPE